MKQFLTRGSKTRSILPVMWLLTTYSVTLMAQPFGKLACIELLIESRTRRGRSEFVRIDIQRAVR